jgi:hypothetical protein
MQCFWCDVPVDEKAITRDHLVSRPMRKVLGKKNGIVKCCHFCNKARCKITTLAKLVLETRESPKRKEELILKHREKLSYTINFFRVQINDKLEGKFKRKCLKEIDLILNFSTGAT